MSEATLTGAEILDLQILAEPTSYTLTVKATEETSSVKVAAADLTVAPVVGNAFAGVLFGLYSFGRGEPVLDPADFCNIRLEDMT